MENCNNNFRLYLKFNNEDLGFEKIEITEPVGFDASSFTGLTNTDRESIDVEYSNAEINLEFNTYKGEKTNNSIQLPNGVVIDRLTMGTELILYAYSIHGFETDIDFIIERNGLEFIIGQLDCADGIETNGIDYFKCKIIQNDIKAILERRADIKVDLFSEKDLNDNYVKVIPTSNIFMKPKPITQVSEWGTKEIKNIQFYGNAYSAYFIVPVASGLTKYDIADSFQPFDPYLFVQNTWNIAEIRDANKILLAQEPKKNLKITIKKFKIDFFFGVGSVLGRNFTLSATRFIPGQSNTIETQRITFTPISVFTYEEDEIVFEFDVLNTGEAIDLSFGIGFSSSAYQSYNMTFFSYTVDKVTVTATSTAFPSVITGVRQYDFLESTIKHIDTNYSLSAKKYDFNSVHYDNFIANGFMMRQFLEKDDSGIYTKTIKPFYSTFKDAMKQLEELNSDYRILGNNTVYIGDYKDFYANRELFVSREDIPDDYIIYDDSRYQLQGFNYKYNKFKQDENSTLDAVHTESEWMLPNKKVESIKQIENDLIRDPFEIESIRRINFSSDSSVSNSNDDSYIAIHCMPLPANFTFTMEAVINYSADSNTQIIKMIAPKSVNWMLLGFGKGDILLNVKILDEANEADLTLKVQDFEPTLLTLHNESGTNLPNWVLGQHNRYVELEYYVTDAQFINVTNEGFDLIENISEPDQFSNLNYTIRRNMKYWESFLHTCGYYQRDKLLKNTYWKSNGELITKLSVEETPIKENESTLIRDLDNPVVTPRVFASKIRVSFEEMYDLYNKLDEINPDGTIGGFIRIKIHNDKVIKGYLKEFSYNWGTGILDLELREKYESETCVIDRFDGYSIKINEVGYNQYLVKPLNFRATGNFIQLFDKNWIPLNNPLHYSMYNIRGIIYDNVIDTTTAIKEIWLN